MFASRLFAQLTCCAVAALLVSLSPPRVSAQQVSGTVFARDSGDPVEGARVFVDATTIGAVTDAGGQFTLGLPPQPSFTIVTYFPNFEVQETAHGTASSAAPLRIELVPAAAPADPPAPAADRDAAMRLLTDALFTWSNWGRKCTIVNPDALDLRSGPGRDELTAQSAIPIEMTNEELGYRMTWYGFRFTGGPHLPVIHGRVFFEEHGDAKKHAKKWLNNRKEAYRGSFRHFARSLVDERLRRELFGAYHVDDPGSLFDGRPVAEMGRDRYGSGIAKPILREGSSPDVRTLMFNGWLYVSHPYSGSLDAQFVERYWPISPTRDLLLEQTSNSGSWILLSSSSLTLDRTGAMLDYPSHVWIQLEGAMGMRRFDRMLPNDYVAD